MSKKRKKHKDIPLGEASTESEGALRISTIPSSFYGGKNPEVYSAAAKKPKKVANKKPKEIVPTPPVVEAPKPKAPTPVPVKNTDNTIPPPKEHSKKKMILILVLLGIVVVGIVTFFVLKTSGVFDSPVVTPPPVVQEIVVPPVEEVVVPEPEEVVPPVVTTTEEIIPIVTSTDGQFPIEFPRLNNTVSPDLDADDLTDAEEEVFETDPGIWDTDEDGYNDGREVRNLYNPSGFAPVKVIDSAAVREYANTNWGYRLYYPAAWNLSPVNNDASEVLISGISGDYIAIYARTKLAQETFEDWFDRVAVGENLSDISEISNRFNVPLSVREDGLVGYFISGDNVFTVVYYPNELQQVAYRSIMNLVLQSFIPNIDSVSVLPDQVILPGTIEENAANNIVETDVL